MRLLGSRASNPLVAQALGQEDIRSQVGEEGFVLRHLPGARPKLVIAGGSRAGTIYATSELLNYHLESDSGDVRVPHLDLLDKPAFAYRILWVWDHSTNWNLAAPGNVEYDMRTLNYLKPAETFLKDFKLLLDSMADHRFNGLIIWGFLRDAHGGVEAARELVKYASERGVRILPGVGTSFYGGFYYQGSHRFNVESWLAQHPELRFLDAYGKFLPDAICPSKPANQQWLREGAEWLFSTFPELGGVNLEHGDFMACHTEDCRRARSRLENDPNYSWDMKATQLPVIEAGQRIRPGAWFTYATYTGFSAEEIWRDTPGGKGRPQFVRDYPESTVCQWTLTNLLGSSSNSTEAAPEKWPRGLRPPTKHSIGLIHQGTWEAPTRWWSKAGKLINVDAMQRYEPVVELLHYAARRSQEEGLEGLVFGGETSSAVAAADLNYLALEEFTWHPSRDWEEFTQGRLARVYGNCERARLFLNLLESPEREPKKLSNAYWQATEQSEDRALSPRQKQRWRNLAYEMARRLALATHLDLAALQPPL